MQTLAIDHARLLRDIETLATFTEPDTDGWTRRAFSPAFVAGREWVADRMRRAGLEPRIDAAGNLIGRRGATGTPALVIGSHTDTVPGAGRFDGMLGVLAGIAIAQALQDAGQELAHPLEVIDFLAEEPTPYGSCIGSHVMTNNLETPLDFRDATGRTLADMLYAVGGQPDALASAVRQPGEIAAYLELHIEQGRVLEAANAPIGIVSGIVGIRRAMLHFTGRPDHAGATPMTLRHDALAAAAATVLAAEQAAQSCEGAVATVGALSLSPNQSNVVPGEVEMQVEMRCLQWETVEQIWNTVTTSAEQAGLTRGVTFHVSNIHDMGPMQTPGWLRDVVTEACMSVAPNALVLPSGAGHDASWMSRIAPAGMIFVRSRDGRSHCPEEYSSPEDIAAGVEALARALLLLDDKMTR
ncbi:MAG TPA: Zn-dependent hydrolase [Roseiflexaceae bacterium]|jgi:N-carbamoyl-L-amino-acid hydrolase|nr:Zn-dependent hydrolase [Roseiflexaceae bacterium]